MTAATIFDELSENAFVIVADYEDLTDLRDLGYRGEAVGDDRVAYIDIL